MQRRPRRNKKIKSRGVLVFSKIPSLPSAGSRPGFSILLWVVTRGRSYGFLWAGSIIQKNVRKDNPTPAYSPLSDRRRLTALIEVHWARRVQAPMPQISGPNLQENHIIETCKEEGCTVSTQETAERREWAMGHSTRLSAPWTNSRPHPRIVNQLVGGNQYYVNLWKL
jgi:hypothetical protein